MNTNQLKTKFYYLFENYDLWIWDFDLTLLNIHSYKDALTTYDVGRKKQKDLLNDFADPEFFITLVNMLIMNNKKIGVISFGTYNVIKTYLERVMGNNYIFNSENILTPLLGDSRYGEVVPCPPENKNEMIQKLAKKYNVNMSRIIFFDDSKNNILAAKKLGVMASYVSPSSGFTELYLRNVEAEFRKLLSIGKIKSDKIDLNQSTDDSSLAFSHSAMRFVEGIQKPQIRDDLDPIEKERIIKTGDSNELTWDNWTRTREDKTEKDKSVHHTFNRSDCQNDENGNIIFKNPMDDIQVGIEGFEDFGDNNSDSDSDSDSDIIEGFQNNIKKDTGIYWLRLQWLIEIVAVLVIIWYLYSKYI